MIKHKLSFEDRNNDAETRWQFEVSKGIDETAMRWSTLVRKGPGIQLECCPYSLDGVTTRIWHGLGQSVQNASHA